MFASKAGAIQYIQNAGAGTQYKIDACVAGNSKFGNFSAGDGHYLERATTKL